MDEKSLKWLIPVCTAICVIVLLIDISIKNAIIWEAEQLRREIANHGTERESTADKRDNQSRDNRGRFTAHVVGGNAAMGTGNGASPVSQDEDRDV